MDGDRSAPRRASRATGLRRLGLNAALAVASIVASVGVLALVGAALVRLGIMEVEPPMRTLMRAGSEDWRWAHITADDYREPDPVLLWRPIASRPYTKQRFKGPVVAETKPAGVFRIFCYGDSNTDGPIRGTWPERLQQVLDRERGPDDPTYEVLNAGVAGYSSHQGLLRFRQEARRFAPDLVLVSFGWNDVATALGAPDRDFDPPGLLAAIERPLLHFTFYRLARQLARRASPSPPPVGPRVPIADYLANMRGFVETAREVGAEAVFLTRPHRETPPDLERAFENWRSRVPSYNNALRRFGREEGQLVVDVERFFRNRPALFGDECHFDRPGLEAMASLLHEVLAAEGKLGAARRDESDG
jgi:lysophospholipase L1-like esterase